MSVAPASHGRLVWLKPDIEFLNHQVDGVRKLARMESFILADDMGLGKSLQALATIAIDFEKGWAHRFLVVCTATLKSNWSNDDADMPGEIQKFTHFKAMVLNGTPKEREKQLMMFDAGPYQALVINYEQVGPHLDALNAIGFDVIIYDEAHAIKNRTAKRSKAALKLMASRHMVVTGSPILNNADDLWSLLHRVDPAEFGSYWQFRQRYCLMGGFQGKQLIGVKNEAELHGRLQKYMVRRLKKDCLDLPEKQYITVKLDLTDEQRKLYRQIRDEELLTIPSDPTPMQIENALTKFLKLKQVCGTTATIEGYDDHSSKLDRGIEMALELIASGEPVTFWTQFRGVLAALEARCAAKGIPFWQLHGDVKNVDRVPTINEWSAQARGGNPGVLGSMLQVGGVGLNMTVCRTPIFLDKLFVPKLNEQAEDRHHRIGTTGPVQVYSLVCRGTIEARIETILRNKQKIFGAVVEGNDLDFKKALIAAVLAEKEDE